MEENGCDPKDPNYDSSEDMEHGSRLQTKQSVQAMIYKEAVRSLPCRTQKSASDTHWQSRLQQTSRARQFWRAERACDGCNVGRAYLPNAEGVNLWNIQIVFTGVQVVGIIKEYFLSGDAQEATTSLQASNCALPFCNLHHPQCSFSFDVQIG